MTAKPVSCLHNALTFSPLDGSARIMIQKV